MPDDKIRSKPIVFVIIIAIVLACAGSIFMTIHKFRNIPFTWDAAAYACDGLYIARDLKAGDIISLVGDTYRHGWWPFFHSWLLAPAFIVLGNTYAAARLVSLFCFVVFTFAAYGIGLEMSRKSGHWIGLVTVCLAVTSLPLLAMSAMAMEEIPGLMMTFLTFFCYLKARRHQKPWMFFLAGILMGLTFFTKWHHGVFVVFAVLLVQLISEKKIFSANSIRLLFPFLLMMIGWFAYPRHILSFWGHSTFQPQYYQFLSAANLLFYPRSFLQVYHASPVIGAIIGGCFLISLKNLRDNRTRLFAAYVAIGIVLMTVKLDNRHRYILTLAPAIWLLGSTQLFKLLDLLRSRLGNRARRILAAGAFLGMSSIVIMTVPGVYRRYPNSLQKYELYCDERQNDAYSFIAQNTSRCHSIAVFSTWDYYNSLRGSTIKWNIEVEREKNKAEITKAKRTARTLLGRLVRNRDKDAYSEFIGFLEDKDVKVIEYHLLSFMKAVDKEAYQELRQKMEINPFSDRIVNLDSLANELDCLMTICRRSEILMRSFVDRYMGDQNDWDRIRMKEFSDLGIIVSIYERKHV